MKGIKKLGNHVSHPGSISLVRLFFILGCFSNSLRAQEAITWDLLGKVNFHSQYDESSQQYIEKPEYHSSITNLNQQSVTIRGYVMPLDATGEEYILSGLPYSSCFFCGGGGIETVMELELKNKNLSFDLDEVVTFEGTFRLNDDPLGLLYQLKMAKPVKE